MSAPTRPGPLGDFLRFLRERPVLWAAVLLGTAALLVWLAWTTVQLPDSPFTYQVP